MAEAEDKVAELEAAGAEKDEALQSAKEELRALTESASSAAASLADAEGKVAELECKLGAAEIAGAGKDVVCKVALQSAQAELAALKESASAFLLALLAFVWNVPDSLHEYRIEEISFC